VSAITWDGALDAGKFKNGVAYESTIVLTETSGYSLKDIRTFTYSGATTVTTLTDGIIKVAFPAVLPNAQTDTITLPVPHAGIAPAATLTIGGTAEFTLKAGSIVWKESNASGADAPDKFAAGKTYYAEFVIEPKDNTVTLQGLKTSNFTVTGFTVSSAVYNSTDGSMKLGVTASSATETLVTVGNVAGITAPATSNTPAAGVTADTEYTGTVTWLEDGVAFSGTTFTAGKTYTATVTLTAEADYTFYGVGADEYAVSNFAGADTDGVTNTAGTATFSSGAYESTIVITVVYPATS